MGSDPEHLIRIIGTLGLILGGVLVAGRLARSTRGAPGAALRVVGRLSLGKGAALLLVSVGERRFLVGTGEHGPRLLAELRGGDGEHLEIGSRTLGGVERTSGAPHALSDLPDGPGTGLVEQLRRMTLRTSRRSRVVIR